MSAPAARRARRLNAFVEHVDKGVLWELYNGMCGLCHQPVKLHRLTIDHITPLSKGGLHSYENTQPAHAMCNHVKGNGEFSLEALQEAQAKRRRRRSKQYRNVTGRFRPVKYY